MAPMLVMPPKIAKLHSASTPANHPPVDVTHRVGVPGTLTSGATGSPEVMSRRINPIEAVGGMVSIKIK